MMRVLRTDSRSLALTVTALSLVLWGCAHRPSAESPVPAGQILWFDRDTQRGYEWSFFLYFPAGVSPSSSAVAPLLVMPNNSGVLDDEPGVHRGAALKQLFSWRSYAQELGAVLLVPTFPRPAASPQLYTHALDRDTLLTEQGALRRLDLQLMAMIASAHRFMGSPGDKKVLIFGFSAGGMFANRFTLLHPEVVLAAAIGSPGGWPMAPLEQWQSDRLRYPLGSADLLNVTGSPLRVEALRRVPFFFFLGARDGNDSVPFRDGYESEDEALVMRALGPTPVSRWPVAEEMYRQARLSADFKLYPEVGHDVTAEMDADVLQFFSRVLSRQKHEKRPDDDSPEP